METNFNSISKNSKIWIYQSDKPFSESQENEINNYLSSFISNWKAHGVDLMASFTIKYHQFIIIAVDERTQMATGCSIDESVKMIKKLESNFNISLLDRSKIAVLKNQNVEVYPLKDLKSLIQAQKISSDCEVFDNSIITFDDWKKKWLLPVNKSWMKRYFVN